MHHFPDMIIDTIRRNNGWGCTISISDERDCLLDTGGGLKKVKSEILNAPILACNVDILSNIDIRALIARYEQTGVSQLVVSERQTRRYLLFDEQNLLRGWTNIATGECKPSSIHQAIHPSFRRLAFSGMQILAPEVLTRLDEMEKEKFSLIDFYLHLCEQNSTPSAIHHTPLQAYVPKDYKMMDVGKIDQIQEAESFAESL